MSKVAFYTLGCKVNQSDTAAMQELFIEAGYKIVDFNDISDVYVINTCVVTNMAEAKSRQIIRRAIRTNPFAIIAVTGCYSQVEAEKVRNITGVNLVLGNDNRNNIIKLIEEARLLGYAENVTDLFSDDVCFENIHSASVDDRKRAYLKIQEGCNQFCSFCIIPYARGRIRSRSIKSIVEETKNLVSKGFKEIVIIGIHLGAYGKEHIPQTKLSDAVKAVLSVEGVERLRLGSIESVEIEDELLELFKTDSRLCRHLHIPLQSGSNEILKKMNRPYDTDEFLKLVTKVRNKINDMAITTDIIVGFPGETKELFQETIDFLNVINFSQIHVFPFSVRKGTKAEKMTNKVTNKEKEVRVHIVSEVSASCRENYLRNFIGKELNVLLEESDGLSMHGLSDNYIKVTVPHKEKMLGNIIKVEITKIIDGSLEGIVI